MFRWCSLQRCFFLLLPGRRERAMRFWFCHFHLVCCNRDNQLSGQYYYVLSLRSACGFNFLFFPPVDQTWEFVFFTPAARIQSRMRIRAIILFVHRVVEWRSPHSNSKCPAVTTLFTHLTMKSFPAEKPICENNVIKFIRLRLRPHFDFHVIWLIFDLVCSPNFSATENQICWRKKPNSTPIFMFT